MQEVIMSANINTAQKTLKKGGLYCYLMTPFDAKGDIQISLFSDYAARMIEAGVEGLTCIASTCEGPYLTEKERHLVASTVGKVAAGRVPINIGIGAISTRQAIEYAKQARDCGATSLMLEMQQYFPIGFDEAYRHYEEIANAVPLEIRLYNITGTTRFDFTPDLIARMASIKSIKSVKEASGDVTRIRDVKALSGDRFNLFCGFHYQILDAMRFGAIGWEAGMHPTIAPACIALFRAAGKDPTSDQARKLYQRLQPLFYFFKYNGVPQSIKALSAWSDLNLGKPRAPLKELSPAQVQRLRTIVDELALAAEEGIETAQISQPMRKRAVS
jgi:4-hydroxy-tetrahydrodipicolinate synthase